MTESVPARDGKGPNGIDTTVAHSARVWNYWLGGKDYFAADKAAGDQVSQMFPDIVSVARADRAFLRRVVHFLAGEAGIRQFLDIGTGLPSHDNTHQVAQRIAPESRIVYVDNDPLVLVHARALLTSTPPGKTSYIEIDARAPGEILAAAKGTIDFSRPIAIMMLGVLNFVLDTDEVKAIIERLLAAVPSGSYLAMTHPTHDIGDGSNIPAMRFWNENVKPPIRARSREELTDFFSGLELLEPGIVSCSRWRWESDAEADGQEPAEVAQFGVLGRKP
jgi:O-methyltransferase involved in polyketide biosynthesis